MAEKPDYAELKAKIASLEQQLVDQARSHANDIAHRKKAEKALYESEEKFRTLMEQSPNMIFINQGGRVIYCNKKCEETMGYEISHICSHDFDFMDLIAPESKELVVRNFRKHLSGEDVSPYEYKILDNSGIKRDAIITTKLIQYEGDRAILGIVTDITEKKRLEAQLQWAQKMEALGTLAGGIAHDFNNLLMGIQGNASLMLLNKTPDHPDFEKLKNIEEYVENGADLTKPLLGFAKQGKYEVRPTDLNSLITRIVDMFGRTKKEIVIHMNLQETLWVAEVDQGQIRQVLLNLLVNAWQAMPGGGDLFIETANLNMAERNLKLMELDPGKYIKIAVTDTGIGINPLTLDKIFDPFYTTKDRGRGTGLGLASAYGIIKTHRGIIVADSDIDRGARIEIYLPASEKAVMSDRPPVEDLEIGSETILIIDDEKPILDISREMLESIGYRVITAQSGYEALELFEQEGAEIHLIILDIIMPGIGGEDTYDRIRTIDPKVKILLSSGYRITDQASRMIVNECTGFLQKPFNLKSLSKKVKSMLS